MGSGLKKEITLQPLFGPLLKSTAAETLGSIKELVFQQSVVKSNNYDKLQFYLYQTHPITYFSIKVKLH